MKVTKEDTVLIRGQLIARYKELATFTPGGYRLINHLAEITYRYYKLKDLAPDEFTKFRGRNLKDLKDDFLVVKDELESFIKKENERIKADPP